MFIHCQVILMLVVILPFLKPSICLCQIQNWQECTLAETRQVHAMEEDAPASWKSCSSLDCACHLAPE